LDSTKKRRVVTGFGRGKTDELNAPIHSNLFDDRFEGRTCAEPHGSPPELAKTNLCERQPESMTLGLDAGEKASWRAWEKRKRLHDARERATELLAHDVYLGDAELALLAATTELGENGL
jgi:hypothetical protein